MIGSVAMKLTKHVEVLLVEDNAGDILLMRQVLARESFPISIRVARDGEQALHLLGDSYIHPDLIILDLNIPKVSGLSVIERCRPEVPVVVFTALTSPQNRVRAMDLGVKAYVEKPSDLGEFTSVVSRMVRTWVEPQQRSREATYQENR